MSAEAAARWVDRLMGELHAADERAIALARRLGSEQLNWKAHPGEWSIGQCLDHLHVSNKVYGGAIARALEGRPRGVAPEITPGWFGRWFIRNVIEPSPRAKKRRAPKQIAPAARVEPSILDRFLSSNQAARELVQQAGHYDVNGIRFNNPFVPLVRFTVGTGLEILTRHEHRHLLQAERIRRSAGFPA